MDDVDVPIGWGWSGRLRRGTQRLAVSNSSAGMSEALRNAQGEAIKRRFSTVEYYIEIVQKVGVTVARTLTCVSREHGPRSRRDNRTTVQTSCSGPSSESVSPPITIFHGGLAAILPRAPRLSSWHYQKLATTCEKAQLTSQAILGMASYRVYHISNRR